MQHLAKCACTVVAMTDITVLRSAIVEDTFAHTRSETFHQDLEISASTGGLLGHLHSFRYLMCFQERQSLEHEIRRHPRLRVADT